MPFHPRRLNELIRQGYEAVRYARRSDKLGTDISIVEKMALLDEEMGTDRWEAETFRRYRGKKQPRRPLSKAILNKLVYVCLTEAGEIVGANWADDIFAANDMGRGDMHPKLRELLDVLDERRYEQPERGTSTPITGPLQRPPRPEYFVGRRPELENVIDNLAPGRMVTIWGPGGVGKSALAAEVVGRLSGNGLPPAKFPDGVIYYNFYNQPEIALAFEHIALSYQVEPRPTPRSAARRALSGRKALLVLDGAEVADNLADVLTVAADCGVLITTRRRLDGAGTFIQKLTPLATDEAVTLFQKWIDFKEDEAIVGEICRLVDGLPLAVQLAGRYLAATQETAANYLKWLHQSPLSALHHGEHQHQSIPILLHKSLQQVSERAQRIFIVIAVLAPTSFAIEPVAAALEQPATEIRAALNELLLFGLLRRVDERYQVGHLLIYAHAQRHYQPSVKIVRKLVEYFANLGLAQLGRGVAGVELLAPERRHGMQLLAECHKRQEWEAAQWLTRAFDEYLDLQGYWTDRLTALEIALAAARGLNDLRTEARCMSLLGDVHLKQGRFSEARQFLQHATDLAGQSNDPLMYTTCLFDLGNVYYAIGEPVLALEHYQTALSLLQETNNERLTGICLGHIGLAYQRMGETDLAVYNLEQGLASVRRFKDRTSENSFLSGLGLAYFDAGDPQRAIAYHTQALAIVKKTGDRRAESVDLGNLGIALFYAHQPEVAIQKLRQALELSQEIDDEVSQARWLVQLGEFYWCIGDDAQAVKFYTEALPLLERFSPDEAAGVRIQVEDISAPDDAGDSESDN